MKITAVKSSAHCTSPRSPMHIMTVHRILIGSAVALFIFYAGWEFMGYLEEGEVSALWRSLASVIAAVGFACYLRSVWHKP